MVDTETQLNGLLLFHKENSFVQNPFKNMSSDGKGNTSQVINDIPNPKDADKFIQENIFKVLLFLNEFELINKIDEIPKLYEHLFIKKFNEQPLLKSKEDGIIEITTAGKLFMSSNGFVGELERQKMQDKIDRNAISDYPFTRMMAYISIGLSIIAIIVSMCKN